MVNSLERSLQPGERILYHPRQSWLCSETAPYLATNLLCIVVLAAAGLVTFDQAGLVALASVIVSFLGFALRNYPRNAPSEAMVTDRRLIQKCGLFNSRLIEVPVAAVKQVVAHEDGILVFKREGEIVLIRHPNSALGLGIALAYAADLPPPRQPQRLETHMDDLWLTCVVLTSLSIGVFLLKWLFLSYGTAIFSLSLVVGVGTFLLGGIVANVVGVVLGGLLCLALTRPFLSYEGFRLWIDNSTIFWPDPDDEKDDDCLQNMHLWFADRLYSRGRCHVNLGG